jgi:hypothetical protein
VTLEQSITGSEPPSIVGRIEAAAISSVLYLRCAKHYPIRQHNKNEHGGGECGGCIIEEFGVMLAQRDQRIAMAREILQPLTNSVNPSVLAIREAVFILR